jgi:hypothetical protein
MLRCQTQDAREQNESKTSKQTSMALRWALLDQAEQRCSRAVRASHMGLGNGCAVNENNGTKAIEADRLKKPAHLFRAMEDEGGRA